MTAARKAKLTEEQKAAKKQAKKDAEAIERVAAEARFVAVLRAAGNVVEAEVAVHNSDGRKWRVDYFIIGHHFVALEIQGWGFGHVGRTGWLRDIEKAQAIAANRWLYVPVTREQVANGEALEALSRCGVKVEAP